MTREELYAFLTAHRWAVEATIEESIAPSQMRCPLRRRRRHLPRIRRSQGNGGQARGRKLSRRYKKLNQPVMMYFSSVGETTPRWRCVQSTGQMSVRPLRAGLLSR